MSKSGCKKIISSDKWRKSIVKVLRGHEIFPKGLNGEWWYFTGRRYNWKSKIGENPFYWTDWKRKGFKR